MSEYMISVFGICLVGGACTILAYGQGRVESLVVGIITLWIILLPIADCIRHFEPDNWLDSIEIPDYTTNSQIGEVIEDAFAQGVTDSVAEKFSLNSEDIRVRLYDFDDGKLRADRIRIILSGRAVFADYKAIEKYINEMDIGVCNVEIEMG